MMSAAPQYGPIMVPLSLPNGELSYGHHFQPSDFVTSDLEILAQGSPYALGHLTPQDRAARLHSPVGTQGGYDASALSAAGMPHPMPPLSNLAQRQGPSPSGAGPVRRRISRACDQCNQLRTKCDGRNPCAHCVEFGLNCEYMRERKKRGKASRKELQQQQRQQPVAGASCTSPRSLNETSTRTAGQVTAMRAAAAANGSVAKRVLNCNRARDALGSPSPTPSGGYVDDSASDTSMAPSSPLNLHQPHHQVSAVIHPGATALDHYLPPMSDVAGFPVPSAGLDPNFEFHPHVAPGGSGFSEQLLEQDMTPSATGSINRPPGVSSEGFKAYGVDETYGGLQAPLHAGTPFGVNMMSTGGLHPQADTGDWVPLPNQRRADMMPIYNWQADGTGLAL